MNLLGDDSGFPTLTPTEIDNIGKDIVAIYDLVKDPHTNEDVGFVRNLTQSSKQYHHEWHLYRYTSNTICLVTIDPPITFHRRLAGRRV